MTWTGAFQMPVPSAFNAVDAYFNIVNAPNGGPARPVVFEQALSSANRLVFRAPDFLGEIAFVGGGLQFTTQQTPSGTGSFPRLTGGVIQQIEFRFNSELDRLTTLRSQATTELQRITLDAQIAEVSNAAFLTEQAVVVTTPFSAAALGDAVLASYQNFSSQPLFNFVSQFDHVYTGVRPFVALSGFNGNDRLTGVASDHFIVGLGGNDVLDVVQAGGINQLDGGPGSDLYLLGPGANVVSDNGLPGERDLVSYAASPQGLTIDVDPTDGSLSTGWAANDTFSGIEGAIGSRFDDVMVGRTLVQGPVSSDWLDGNDGDDSIAGGEGSDTLIGGAGYDGLQGNGNADAVGNPGSGDMAIWQTAPSDVHFFVVQNGNLLGSPDAGAQFLPDFGNPPSGLVVATPREGVDFVTGVELFRFSGFSGPVFTGQQLTLSNAALRVGGDAADGLAGGAGVDLLYGRRGDDTLSGGNAADLLVGDEGADRLQGDGGDDTALGGVGDDRILGGAGRDLMEGGSGNDALSGGTENDTLDGGDGDDFLFGGAQDDFIRGGAGQDTIGGSDGADSALGGAGDDTLGGGQGSDTLRGGEGADRVEGHVGQDTLFGGTENDTLGGGNDNDWVHGNTGDDTVRGGTGLDSVFGGNGQDRVEGGADADTVWGGDGADTVFGDGGDDFVHGGGQNDTVFGGQGNDTLGGGDGNDSLVGGTGNDLMNGGEGADTLRGNDGSDTANGNGGTDLIFGQEGGDRLDGGDGRDTVYGNEGDDTLSGGRGDDAIVGGFGTDLLRGDDGADVFIFNALADLSGAAGLDRIGDFEQGSDRIHLSGIDALAGAPGDQAFTFVGTAAHDGSGATLRFTQGATATFVYGDVDADGLGDFALALEGSHALTAADFVL